MAFRLASSRMLGSIARRSSPFARSSVLKTTSVLSSNGTFYDTDTDTDTDTDVGPHVSCIIYFVHMS